MKTYNVSSFVCVCVSEKALLLADQKQQLNYEYIEKIAQKQQHE